MKHAKGIGRRNYRWFSYYCLSGALVILSGCWRTFTIFPIPSEDIPGLTTVKGLCEQRLTPPSSWRDWGSFFPLFPRHKWFLNSLLALFLHHLFAYVIHWRRLHPGSTFELPTVSSRCQQHKNRYFKISFITSGCLLFTYLSVSFCILFSPLWRHIFPLAGLHIVN